MTQSGQLVSVLFALQEPYFGKSLVALVSISSGSPERTSVRQGGSSSIAGSGLRQPRALLLLCPAS